LPIEKDELHESSIRVRSIVDTVIEAILVINTDHLIEEFNNAAERTFGYQAEEVIGKNINILMPEPYHSGHDKYVESYIQTGQAQIIGKGRDVIGLRKDGSEFPIQLGVSEMRIGSRILFTGIITDITERKQAEKALKDSEDRFRSIIDNAPIGIAVVSLEGKFELVNQSLCEIVGYNRNELEKLTFQKITHPDDIESDLENIKQLLEGDGNFYRMEKRYIRKDTQIVWIQLTVSLMRDSDGTPKYFISQIEDISLRKQAESLLKEANRKYKSMSITDGLTGIANRRRFDEVLAQEYSRHARSGSDLSLLLLDIDHFKAFNDTYGHVQGDECLREVSQAISNCITRPADLAARYGGEEFSCILPETDLRGAVVIAEKIRQSIIDCAIRHETSSVAKYVTASIGVITVKCTPDKTVEDLLTQVDELLYQAKSRGRNRIEYNEPPVVDEHSDNRLLQLVWKSSFCSGNQLIDSQHQSLFHVANDLLVTIIAEYPKEVILSKLNHLLDCITHHFHDEEHVLESAGFPDLKKHSLEHAELHERVLALAHKFMTETVSADDIFHLVIHDVVMQHMLESDREFFPYVNQS
jgi:diguanylate cyclase (GGDEF)-like protein/PAS domain S-box-containing protein/hemerythrin-like metal-binding protein